MKFIRKSIAIRAVEFGKNVTVIDPVNLYECKIGDNSFIGPFTEIGRGAIIGKNCRIQSHAYICEMVTIGDNCFISHGVKFINDPFYLGGPAGGDKNLWRPTNIGCGVSIGTNATILPVSIAGGIIIGAGSVVTKDMTDMGIYAGNPARKIRDLGC